MPAERQKSRNEKRLPARAENGSETSILTILKTSQKRISKLNFPIVAVGASAGGLEAFTKLLNNISEKSGIAFVLVQHLDPSHASSLPELLSRQSVIPVLEATNGIKVKPDHVYVIPSGKSMYIHRRKLSLVEQPIPGLGHGIDIFFSSLAEDIKEKAIGIILSGTGTDGVAGAKAIKAQSGMIIVQDPESAKYDGMPQAAIAAGVADRVLLPETMGSFLLNQLHQPDLDHGLVKQPIELDVNLTGKILSLVKDKTRRDFSGYKTASIHRRLKHRMDINQISNLNDYLKFLQKNPVEIEALVKDFLINVTSFFRDEEAFDSLKKEIKALVQNKTEGDEIRVWVPACATGEEAYSIAILLEECIEDQKRHLQIQVFGTDVDAEVISFARAANYPLSIAKDVKEERLKKYFNKYDTQYKVKKNLRDRLVFAVQDIVIDPPYSRMDIISLRNLLIYLDLELQKKVLSKIHYSLNKGGLMLLGTAETVGEYTDLFEIINRKWRIYRAINKEKALLTSLPDNLIYKEPAVAKPQESGSKDQIDIKRTILPQNLLLQALPPTIIVDNEYQVVYTHGETGKYLQLPQGKPTVSLLQMVNQNLRTTLLTAFQEATKAQKAIVRMGQVSKQYGSNILLQMTVLPLPNPVGSFVITFQDIPTSGRKRKNDQVEPAADIKELEQELTYTRESLRSTVEELETSNEELQASNEEFQSTNEELQSANEELESSREELQSTNEELGTINSEYQKKIELLDTVNDDMNNLLNSTNIATVFLDEELKILRFTPAITSLFNFVETDKGRPIDHITSHLRSSAIVQLAHRVLENLVPVEKTVETDSGQWFSMRIFPYRTIDNTIAGVVVSFIDINKERIALNFAQSVIDIVREPLMVLDDGLKIVSVNKSFYKTFHVTREKTEGQLIYKFGKGQWDLPELRKLLENILSKNLYFNDFRVEYKSPESGNRVMLINVRRVLDELGSTRRILLAMEDITGRGEFASENVNRVKIRKQEKS